MADNNINIGVVNSMSLEDFFETPLRVYVYKLVGTREDVSFTAPNTTSLVRMSPYDTGLKDEKGNFYIEVIPNINQEGQLGAPNVGAFIQQFKTNVRIQAIGRNIPIATQKDLTILSSKAEFQHYFYTAGVPYSQQDYLDGKLSVFFTTSGVQVLPEIMDDPDVVYNEGWQEVDFIDIQALLGEQAAQIIPYVSDEAPIISATAPIILNLNSETLLSYSAPVLAEAVVGDPLVKVSAPISLTLKNHGAPLLINPIEVIAGRMHYFQAWLDRDLVMPFQQAALALRGSSITTLIQDQDAEKALLDMLAVSYAYISQFSQFERYTSGPDTGRLIPGKYIGYVGYDIAGIAGEAPQTILGNIYQKYLRDSRHSNDNETNKTLKQLVGALSKYIGGRLSIGSMNEKDNVSGSNSFNEVYLPWYLDLISQIKMIEIEIPNPIYNATGNVKSLVLPLGTNAVQSVFPPIVTLKSRHFQMNPQDNTFVIPTSTRGDELKLVQTDRKLTIPPLGEEIGIIDKLPLAGDIATTNSQDLRYFVTSPAINTNDLLAKYLNYDPNYVDGNASGNYSTTWITKGPFPRTPLEIYTYILEDVAKTNKVPVTRVRITNVESLIIYGRETRWNRRTSNIELTGRAPAYFDTTTETIYQSAVTPKWRAVPTLIGTTGGPSKKIIWAKLEDDDKRTPEDYRIVSGVWRADARNVPSPTTGTYATYTYKEDIVYEAADYRWNNVQYVILNAPQTTPTPSLPMVVNINLWADWLKEQKVPTQIPISLTPPNDTPLITTLDVGTIFNTNIDVFIGLRKIASFPSLQKHNENLGRQRIIFT